MANMYKLKTGTKCPECGEIERIELIDKKETEKETRGIGFNQIRIVPILSYFFRCKKCGEIFLIQVDPDKDGTLVK